MWLPKMAIFPPISAPLWNGMASGRNILWKLYIKTMAEAQAFFTFLALRTQERLNFSFNLTSGATTQQILKLILKLKSLNESTLKAIIEKILI